jgi:hypothetical protein
MVGRIIVQSSNQKTRIFHNGKIVTGRDAWKVNAEKRQFEQYEELVETGICAKCNYPITGESILDPSHEHWLDERPYKATLFCKCQRFDTEMSEPPSLKAILRLYASEFIPSIPDVSVVYFYP